MSETRGGSTVDNGFAGLHYHPSTSGNAFFLAFFAVCLAAQIVLLPCRRLWGYSITLAICFLLETMGYIAKIQLGRNQADSNSYIMYIICLTIGPNFLTGVLFVSLSRFIWTLGREHSILGPRLISWGFITVDFLSLAAVGVGGSLAAIYAPSLTGPYIMIGGLAGQALFTLVFGLVSLDYLLRRHRAIVKMKTRYKVGLAPHLGGHCGPTIRRFAYVVGISSICMVIRAGYRVAELSKGFNGPLAQKELLFFFLDSIPVAIASLCMTVGIPVRDIWYAHKLQGRDTV